MRLNNCFLRCTVVVFILLANLRCGSQAYSKKDLTVFVDKIRSDKGQIGFCLFMTSTGFPNHQEKAMACVYVKATGNSAKYTFTSIPIGTYAVCVFHDENNDKQINTNFIGMPKEGIGVSNNAKGHFGPPKFDDAKFNFSDTGMTIKISLSYL